MRGRRNRINFKSKRREDKVCMFEFKIGCSYVVACGPKEADMSGVVGSWTENGDCCTTATAANFA